MIMLRLTNNRVDEKGDYQKEIYVTCTRKNETYS